MTRIYILFIFLVALSFSVQAGNSWYWGKVLSVNTAGADGSFEIFLDNPSIKTNCLHDRVYFKVVDMGAERTKVALSMALSAFVSEKQWGVVIDLPASEGTCSASSTASQGSGIR